MKKIHIFSIMPDCAYIDLDTREYGAVFSRHSLQDRWHQFVVMAAFRSRYQLVKVQLQILDTKPFQPLKEYKKINTDLKQSFALLLTPVCISHRIGGSYGLSLFARTKKERFL